MSDGAPSDSSHILYREVDPYKSISLGARQGTSNSSIDTAVCDYSKRTPEVSDHPTTIKNSDSNHPLIEEDVDSRELARLTRHLWPSNRYRKFSSSTSAKAQKSNEKHSRSTGSGPVVSSNNHDQISISRPTNLKLRPNLDSLDNVHSKVQVERPKQECNFESPPDDITFDLAWDHEPGTQPLNKHFPQSTSISGSVNYPHDHDTPSRLKHSRIPPIPVDLSRPRRRPVTQRTRGSVAVLPVRDDDNDDEHDGDANGQNPSDRWSSSNRFPLIAKEYGHRKALITNNVLPYLSVLPSPSESADENKVKRLTSNELEDSGFVGLANSFSDFDEDSGLNQSGELLWEHDPFYRQSSPMKPVT